MDTHVWFLVSVCAMKQENLDVAANALTRVIQQVRYLVLFVHHGSRPMVCVVMA